MGFPADFCDIVGQELNTDFTATWMLRYLKAAKPSSIEAVADEMLEILEFRERYIQKQIAKGRRPIVMDDLFIRKFSIDWSQECIDDYVREINAVRSIRDFSFKKNITFFVGENGSGKSTMLEAIAIACGLNPEGGTANYNFHTYDDYSGLGKAIRLVRGRYRPEWSYFLRAESFYNMATVTLTEYNYDRTMPDYHARSHGESFLEYIQNTETIGLYLLDEPEAALSPQRQLSLLVHLVQAAKAGSQFIIATHSPILLGIPDCEIISFDDDHIEPVAYEDTGCYQITKLFIENRDMMLRRLLQEDD